mmetsp:Transcript_36097/g.55443  ORF Transcript_36097/g.55443 Transcript_36097/m.55443 type:complete len:122 (+) Transcript_36097:144-509(+)
MDDSESLYYEKHSEFIPGGRSRRGSTVSHTPELSQSKLYTSEMQRLRQEREKEFKDFVESYLKKDEDHRFSDYSTPNGGFDILRYRQDRLNLQVHPKSKKHTEEKHLELVGFIHQLDKMVI